MTLITENDHQGEIKKIKTYLKIKFGIKDFEYLEYI